MIEKVIVLHEFGAKRHFSALEELVKDREVNKIEYYEANVLKQLTLSILKRNKAEFKRLLKNITGIPKIFFSKNQYIVLGLAPYDIRMMLYGMLKKKNNLIYFTSWPYWDYSFYPKKIRIPFQKKMWEKFLNGITLVSITKKAKETLKKYNVKLFNIAHSIDLSIYDKKKYCLSNEKKEEINIIFVGQLEYNKGLELIIYMIKNNPWDNVKFTILGTGTYQKQIEDLTKNYNVEYHGFIKDEKKKAEIYSKSDIFILPSIKVNGWEELFGIVIIEAMAMGLPVVASDCVGPKEIIDDKKDGFIIKQNNISELKDKLDLLIKDRELRINMGEQALKKAKEYDVHRIKEKWNDILKSFN